MSAPAAPVALAERIEALDAIRGFALLGIFIMNMPVFNTSYFAGADGSHPWPEWWDRGAEIVRDVVFAGKFNSMFSLLFAIGFTIQLERLLAREPQRAIGIYVRRICWLLIFGILHATLLFFGDVLHIYALFGFLLLALRKLPDRVLITLIGLSLLYPAVAGILRMATISPAEVQQSVELTRQWLAADNAIFGQADWLQVVKHNVATLVIFYTSPVISWNLLGGYVQILTTVLLGLLLGRHRFFQNVVSYLPQVRRAQWWALGMGIASGVIYGAWKATVDNPLQPSVWRVIAGTCYVLSRLGIMIFYAATIIRAVHTERWRARLSSITLVGRMPLTNYLMQSALCTFIFYHWGLGLWGTVGPALDFVLAVAIFFAVQVPLTRLWLARFPLGPMEYLWRLLTYGRSALDSRNLVARPSR